MAELNLFLYGEVGADPLSGLATPGPDDIQRELALNSSPDVNVHMSSPGGSVFQGYTIGNILKNSGRNTTAIIEGYCGSIMTFIALSCKKVTMAETARFMIHHPTVDPGNVSEEDAEQIKERLAAITDDLIRLYHSKTGLPVKQISAMMDESKEMTAQEAKAFGFIDDFATPVKAVAKASLEDFEKFHIKDMPKEDTKKVDTWSEKADKLVESITAKIEKALNGGEEPKNITVSLADGGAIFVESEDGELEGKAAFTIDEEGNATDTPVEDGTFSLEDGRSITVEGGIVTSVQEESTDEIDKLRDQIKALEDKAKAEAEKAEAKAKAEAEKEKKKEKALTELMTEMQNLKKITVGDKGPIKKVMHDFENKFEKTEPEAHKLDDFAASLKRIK